MRYVRIAIAHNHGDTGVTRSTSTAAALALMLPVLLAAQSPPALSFTADQASRGRDVYGRACSSCHGQQLTDGTAIPVAGPQFREKWSSPNRSLHELFTLIRTTMPSGKTGSLTTDEYLAVTAYLIESNGVRAGDRALTADRTVLAGARLPAPIGAAAPANAPAGGDAPGWNIRKVVPDYQEGPRGRSPKAIGPSQQELIAADRD